MVVQSSRRGGLTAALLDAAGGAPLAGGVAGRLRAAAQLEALGPVEAVVDPFLAHAGQRGIAIDLARCEDLPPHWQERLRRQALALTRCHGGPYPTGTE